MPYMVWLACNSIYKKKKKKKKKLKDHLLRLFKSALLGKCKFIKMQTF